MKNNIILRQLIIVLAFLLCGVNSRGEGNLPQYDVTVVTCVESLVPNGLGRSRMFTTNVERNYLDFTSQQTKAKKDKNKSKRKDIRLKEYEETKLLNFYNEGGIRFQNIASNDALVSSKINSMLSEGWELFFVSSGVESKMINRSVKKELLKMGINALLDEDAKDTNKDDPNGLFLTRYYFRKEIKQ